MQGQSTSGSGRGADSQALFRRSQAVGFRKHPRLREDMIRVLLFLAASLSVFTTIAIVLVLGTESSRFFTRRAYLDTNHDLMKALSASAEDNLLSISAQGQELKVDAVLEIGTEIMRVIEVVEASTIRVERGYDGTRIVEHAVNAPILQGEAATVLEFLTGARWQPQIGDFGILPLVNATLLTSFIAMLIAGPVGLAVAIYLSEYAPTRVRSLVKPILEILAGIPTVVYGYFALTFVTVVLRSIFNRSDIDFAAIGSAALTLLVGGFIGLVLWAQIVRKRLSQPASLAVGGLMAVAVAGLTIYAYQSAHASFGSERLGTYNMLSAGLVMGIMIVPTISSISEDALSAVPRSLREASYGLGATRLETVVRVLLPSALSGILAAFILGISRAVGETMIVAVASGAGPVRDLTLNPLQSGETMTGHIARISTGDLSFGSIDYNSIFAIGLTLFIITLALNLLSNYVRRRFREVYA